MTFTPKTVFKMAAVLNLRKLPFWSSDRYLHVILHLHSEICINRPIWRRYIARNGFQYDVCPPSWIWKMSIFVKFTCSELKFVSVYQIWSKSDNSRLRYGNKAILKMAAVRHLECAKIAVLVTWPISACDPSFLCQILRWSANMAPRYSQKKTIFNMASVRLLEFAKFQLFVKCPSWELKSTSAYQMWSKSVNSRLKCGYNAIFKMAAVRHLVFEKFRFFCQIYMLAMEICICLPNLIEIG